MTYNTEPFKYRREGGVTYYELSNHLGNPEFSGQAVLVTVTDMKIGIEGAFWTAEYYEATVVSVVDYYSRVLGSQRWQGGSTIKVATAMASTCPFAQQAGGMEKDDEVKGEGNSYDFGARLYDSRVGRWLSVDPWESKYPSQSPYIGNDDNPILIIDPTGKGGIVYLREKRNDDGEVIMEKGKPVMEIVVYTKIYVYTNNTNILANLNQHAQNIQNEINNDWNSVANATLNFSKCNDCDVVFEANVIAAGNSEQAFQTFQQNEKAAKNAIAAGFPTHYQNYIYLDDLGGPNSGFQGMTDGNMGVWNVNPQRRNGHYSHEFGHILYTVFNNDFGKGDHPPAGTTYIMSWAPNRQVTMEDIHAINYGLSPIGSDAQDIYKSGT